MNSSIGKIVKLKDSKNIMTLLLEKESQLVILDYNIIIPF